MNATEPKSVVPPKEEAVVVKAKAVTTLKLTTAVLGLDVSDDAKRLYAACLDGGVYSVDAQSGATELIGKHESFASGVSKIAGTSLLVSAGYDGVLQWHDLAERKTIRKINAHKFWSWQMAMSGDGKLVASATGQYLAGGPKYEPAAEREPSVKVFDAHTGELKHQFSHVPPVQAVALSAEGEYVAAGNLMGEVRVWELKSGKKLAEWTSSSFTSWGTVKSHCYQGGIYGISFTPDARHVIVCGMGPMHDPMAGNGKQTWQKFAWRENPAVKVDEIHSGDHGNGHPESLTFHPSGRYFVMAGRLAQGKWNAGFFDAKSGAMIQSVDAKGRICKAVFSGDGRRLFLAGANGQAAPKDGKFQDYGRISVYDIA